MKLPTQVRRVLICNRSSIRIRLSLRAPEMFNLAGRLLSSVDSLPFSNLGNSNYNSLQVKAEKHASHGLYFLSSFTYSKAINDLPEICCNAPFAQNSYDLGAERGVADFDQKLRWVLSFDYEIPFGGSHSHLDNRAVDGILGGWHVGGIYTSSQRVPLLCVSRH